MTPLRPGRLRPVRSPATLLVLAGLFGPAMASACDICAIYTATEMHESRTGLRLGVAEQFTHFGTLRRGGERVDNPGEHLNSSITQVLVGWNFTPRLGVQVNLPIISRTYRRREEGRLVRGDETGIGDLSLVGRAVAFSDVTETSVFHVAALGGLKLPTGDAERLGGELREEAARADAFRAAHETPGGRGASGGAAVDEASGVHDHDLALGTGSVDGIVGGDLLWSWQRLFVTVAGQYVIRTVGDFDYEFANELTWEAGPGVFVLLGHDHSLAVRAVVSGETKGKDEQQGATVDDTGITALYVGPGLVFTWGTSLAAEITADLPAVQNNTSLQIVPDFRLRGGLVWRF